MARGHAPFENEIMSAATDLHTSVEEAMARVLEAERNALAEIAACEGRADARHREAREAVRAMAKHARERIVRMHTGCAKRTHELVRNLEREASVADRALPGDIETELLSEAVRVVASELTTPGSSDVG